MRRLYLSHNQLSEIPLNLPKSLAELRIHDNKVKKIQKETFKGMNALHVLGKFLPINGTFQNYMQYVDIEIFIIIKKLRTDNF